MKTIDMLSIQFGNLFEIAKPGSMIAHGCNCKGVMGSGFALQIRRRFPRVYLEYFQLFKEHKLLLGEHLAVYSKGYCIFNAFTQENYGRDPDSVYVDYDALEKTMIRATLMAKEMNRALYFPLVGAGRANGDPKLIYSILERVTRDSDATLVLDTDYPVNKLSEKLN